MSLVERALRERAIEHASAVVAQSRKCAIGATRRNGVYGEGDPCASLMVVGEGPGETEDKPGPPLRRRSARA